MTESDASPRYYSQFGEDAVLCRFFDFKRDGFFVEVGAFDGIHFSNTYCFEQWGWRGLCVEPHPRYFPLCRDNRPGSKVLNLACVKDASTTEVSFMAETIGLLSGVAVDEADVNRRYTARGLAFDGFERVTVKAATLDGILREHLPAGTPIDFVSIDVEGTELDVLRGFDLRKYRPRVIVIEANDEAAKAALLAFFADFPEYRFARSTGVNLFFVLGEDEAKRLAALPIEAVVEAQSHPLGERYTVQAQIAHHRPKVSLLRRVWRRVRRLIAR